MLNNTVTYNYTYNIVDNNVCGVQHNIVESVSACVLLISFTFSGVSI